MYGLVYRPVLDLGRQQYLQKQLSSALHLGYAAEGAVKPEVILHHLQHS